MPRKILTIVGTRPELIKMSLVIGKMDLHTNHVLVHTGQNYDYELNQIFFDELGIRQPDHFLGVAGEGLANTIGKIISECDRIMAEEAPDAVLIYGDTNSGLSAIPAKRRKIPIFHMEAGNRSFDQRVPEEMNRKIIDHLSDINMVLTGRARDYLLAEGIRGDRIFKTGSHLPEVLERFRDRIEGSDVLERLGISESRYFVLSAHREENVDSPDKLRKLVETLRLLAETYAYPIIFSIHPRTRIQLERLQAEGVTLPPLVQSMLPFPFSDYIKLQSKAFCVLSDSGTITEEASLLDFPAVTLRDAHERPEGMDAGTLIATRIIPEHVLDAVKVVRAGIGGRRFTGLVPDYEGGDVAIKVVRIVLSYIDVINREVWRKSEA